MRQDARWKGPLSMTLQPGKRACGQRRVKQAYIIPAMAKNHRLSPRSAFSRLGSQDAEKLAT
jgi:hypothetical protein